MRRVAAAIVCVLWTGAVNADPVIHAGAQPAPPVPSAEPALDQHLDARRNIRGCAVDEACGRAQDILREFELERLPPPGNDPWINERSPAGSRLEPGQVRIAKKPSE
nr:hypothetical protein [Deltaproteobacteria bacterium]